MKNVIKRIIENDNVDEIFDYVINNIFRRGPIEL